MPFHFSFRWLALLSQSSRSQTEVSLYLLPMGFCPSYSMESHFSQTASQLSPLQSTHRVTSPLQPDLSLLSLFYSWRLGSHSQSMTAFEKPRQGSRSCFPTPSSCGNLYTVSQPRHTGCYTSFPGIKVNVPTGCCKRIREIE